MIRNAWSMRTEIDDWYEKTRNTWGNALNRAAVHHGNVEAIVYKDRRITFGQLRRYVDGFANGLMALGIKAGDNVGLWMTNCPEWVISQFAIYKIGARMVAINTRYRLNELEYVLKQYCQYYHHERIHQSLGRIIEPIHNIDENAEIVCIERLGGLLKSYHRLAA